MKKNKINSVSCKRGAGLISSIANIPGKVAGAAGEVLNRAIDVLPIELHLPGYQYCGPGTKLQERLQRGDPGINPLDSACKQHDIAYNKYKDSKHRSQADKELANRAWERVKASDASISEKAAAWAVTNIMKVKSKFGGQLKRKKRAAGRKRKSGGGLYLKPYPQQKSGCGIKKKKRTQRRRRRRRH